MPCRARPMFSVTQCRRLLVLTVFCGAAQCGAASCSKCVSTPFPSLSFPTSSVAPQPLTESLPSTKISEPRGSGKLRAPPFLRLPLAMPPFIYVSQGHGAWEATGKLVRRRPSVAQAIRKRLWFINRTISTQLALRTSDRWWRHINCLRAEGA